MIRLSILKPSFVAGYAFDSDLIISVPGTNISFEFQRNIIVTILNDSQNAEISVDSIHSKHAFGNENDCEHYRVDGSATVYASCSSNRRVTRDAGINRCEQSEVIVELENGSRTYSRVFAEVSNFPRPFGMQGGYHDWWDGWVGAELRCQIFIDTGDQDDWTKWDLRITGVAIETRRGQTISHDIDFSRGLSEGWSSYWYQVLPQFHRDFSPYALSYLWELTPTQERLIRDISYRAEQEMTDGDLTEEAANSVRLTNINSIAYLKDFAELGAFAKGMVNTFGKVFSKSGKFKMLAEAYLALHYGLKLTVKDTRELADSFNRIQLEQMVQTLGASRTYSVDLPGAPDVPVSVKRHLKAEVDCWTNHQRFFFDRIDQCKHALYEYDATPSFENLWDLAPYTFIVDWFLPIGDTLGRMELRDYAQTFNLRRAFYSRKYTWANRESYLTIGGNRIEASVSYSFYSRECTQAFALPPMRVDNPKGSFNHFVEAAALILAHL